MKVTEEVSKFVKSNDSKLLQLLNKYLMLFAEEVSKFNKFNDFNFIQS